MATKRRTNSRNFGNDIKKILAEYGDGVLNKFAAAGSKNAEIFSNKLKQVKQPPATSQGSANPKTRRLWNEYSKGWTWDGQTKGTHFFVAIHNKKHYRLTHLLENGHETVNGKTTRAFKHIEPIAREFYDAYMKEVEKDD